MPSLEPPSDANITDGFMVTTLWQLKKKPAGLSVSKVVAVPAVKGSGGSLTHRLIIRASG